MNLTKYIIYSDRNLNSGGVAVFADHFVKYLEHFNIDYEEKDLGKPELNTINVYTVLYVNWLFLFTAKNIYIVVHDLQHLTHPKNFSLKQRFFREIKIRFISLLQIKVLTESAYVREELIRRYGVSEVSKITCFFPNNLIKPKVRGRLDDCLQILYPAKDWPHKRIRELIEWIRTYNLSSEDLELVLNLTNVPETLASDDVIVHGLLSHEELVGLYSKCDLLYINSESESVSIPIFESWQAGMLCACSCYEWSLSQSNNGELCLLNRTNDYKGFAGLINGLKTSHEIEMREKAQEILLNQISNFWL